jgi:transcriptional regulator with XRE-family HTH domain
MNIKDNILAVNEYFELSSPPYLAHTIATHFKTKRMEINISQEELARRSGVSLGSLKRFESLHEISLKNLLKMAVVLNSTSEFLSLFTNRYYAGISDIQKEKKAIVRERAGSKHAKKH